MSDDPQLGYGKEEFDYVHRQVPFFQTVDEIQQKKGKHAMSRFNYLQALVTEFQETNDDIAKSQILAHLANFSYDPVNYNWLRQLHVIDLFLDMLTETNEQWKEFAIGGLCNLCIDPQNSYIISESKGIPLIIRCLSSRKEETVLSAMLTLYYLLDSYSQSILIPPVIDCMKKYATSKNTRIKNLSSIFVQHINTTMTT